MTDTTCPCNREHSNSTITLADGVWEFTITTNVNAVVTDHSVMLEASHRSFGLQTHIPDFPAKIGDVVVTSIVRTMSLLQQAGWMGWRSIEARKTMATRLWLNGTQTFPLRMPRSTSKQTPRHRQLHWVVTPRLTRSR